MRATNNTPLMASIRESWNRQGRSFRSKHLQSCYHQALDTLRSDSYSAGRDETVAGLWRHRSNPGGYCCRTQQRILHQIRDETDAHKGHLKNPRWDCCRVEEKFDLSYMRLSSVSLFANEPIKIRGKWEILQAKWLIHAKKLWKCQGKLGPLREYGGSAHFREGHPLRRYEYDQDMSMREGDTHRNTSLCLRWFEGNRDKIMRWWRTDWCSPCCHRGHMSANE